MDILMLILSPIVLIGILMWIFILIHRLDKKINKREGEE